MTYDEFDRLMKDYGEKIWNAALVVEQNGSTDEVVTAAEAATKVKDALWASICAGQLGEKQ